MERLNVYHRKDGRWEGRILKGRNAAGKRKYKYIFGKSKEEVCDKIRSVRKMSEQKKETNKTVTEICSEWLDSIRHTVKESTFSNYNLKISKHILPCFGAQMITDVSESNVYNFIETKQNNGLSNRYISDIIVVIKSVYKYAESKYNIHNSLKYVSLPKKNNTEVSILDDTQLKILEDYISEYNNRTTVGIALTMSTGLRIGELCGLQWEDIDFEKRILTVRKTVQRICCSGESTKTKIIVTTPKSETSKRCIPLTKRMAELLQPFVSDKKAYLLSGKDTPLEPRTLQYRFAKILKNANLPSVHFHSLRHSFATSCIKLGFDVKALSELLGHSKVEITLNRYVHSSFEQKREYMNRLSYSF